MNSQDVANRYFAAMRAQDLETLVAVFEADGVIVWPDGQSFEGTAAIRAAYAAMFTGPSNSPSPGPLMLAPDRFSTEVHSRFPDGSERRTVNVFRVGENGLIARMDSYRQS
jgi:hypothetical protein